jgi:hypothetical protein
MGKPLNQPINVKAGMKKIDPAIKSGCEGKIIDAT